MSYFISMVPIFSILLLITKSTPPDMNNLYPEGVGQVVINIDVRDFSSNFLLAFREYVKYRQDGFLLNTYTLRRELRQESHSLPYNQRCEIFDMNRHNAEFYEMRVIGRVYGKH